jgi:hypothetical protein
MSVEMIEEEVSHLERDDIQRLLRYIVMNFTVVDDVSMNGSDKSEFHQSEREDLHFISQNYADWGE